MTTGDDKYKRSNNKERERPNDGLEEKVLSVNRCAKVVKGGRKFSFSALVLVGDNNGRVGYGFAKANELTDAIKKGGELARKNLVTFESQNTTIPHEVLVDYSGAKLLLKPAAEGTGVVAGSVVRLVLVFAGIKDVVAKSLGSNNQINQVKAVFKALSKLKNRKKVLELRGVEVK